MQVIQFANTNSSRNEAVVVADHGNKVEVRVWVNPTQRFRSYTEMVEKKWVRKEIKPSGQQVRAMREAA